MTRQEVYYEKLFKTTKIEEGLNTKTNFFYNYVLIFLMELDEGNEKIKFQLFLYINEKKIIIIQHIFNTE